MLGYNPKFNGRHKSFSEYKLYDLHWFFSSSQRLAFLFVGLAKLGLKLKALCILSTIHGVTPLALIFFKNVSIKVISEC